MLGDDNCAEVSCISEKLVEATLEEVVGSLLVEQQKLVSASFSGLQAESSQEVEGRYSPMEEGEVIDSCIAQQVKNISLIFLALSPSIVILDPGL